MQSIVRETVLSAFGLEKTEEYIHLDAADRTAVNNFNTKSRGDGPNVELPEIDMDGKISSPWNVRLTKLLAEMAMNSVQNMSGLGQLPVRSLPYYEELVKDQIERARTARRKVQPQGLRSEQGGNPRGKSKQIDGQ
jgi:hypothetical protein